jgi:hypothetical protein
MVRARDATIKLQLNQQLKARNLKIGRARLKRQVQG